MKFIMDEACHLHNCDAIISMYVEREGELCSVMVRLANDRKHPLYSAKDLEECEREMIRLAKEISEGEDDEIVNFD